MGIADASVSVQEVYVVPLDLAILLAEFAALNDCVLARLPHAGTRGLVAKREISGVVRISLEYVLNGWADDLQVHGRKGCDRVSSLRICGQTLTVSGRLHWLKLGQ